MVIIFVIFAQFGGVSKGDRIAPEFVYKKDFMENPRVNVAEKIIFLLYGGRIASMVMHCEK